ncbi:MAG TPA: type III-A CRISPR-associated RAMP protein Csm3 [Desulfobulbus sp.]|nr:type III-A CRISPR-associated RAMP protein Csm3 [Desulfobulbus sp.]
MSTQAIRLLGYYHVQGEIVCETGLHIGGGNDIIEIGGLDNPVIRHPVTRLPYIPGSSLKGKMRSLLEMFTGAVNAKGNVHSAEDCGGSMTCPICRIFGVSGSEGSSFGPGRLIIRDACLADTEQGGLVREVKYENMINRIKGTAEHPRQMERVPAGTKFSFAMSYRVFSVPGDGDDADGGEVDMKLFDRVLDCLKLLENDTLGGSGSRGYGQVSFQDVHYTDLEGEKHMVDIQARRPVAEIADR